MIARVRKSAVPVLYRAFEFFASLELAVFLILSLAIVLAVGTVYESKYGAAVASREVYRSIWMQVLLWLFMINLAAVALSRLPWKRSHIGFLITHLGLIVLLLGSWITQQRGVDGTLALSPGESGRGARIDETMLYVFRAQANQAYDLLHSQFLSLDSRRPLKAPLSFHFLDGNKEKDIKILRYLPRADRIVKAEVLPVGQGMPGLKFQLTGSRATFSDWLFLQADIGSTREVGPAVFRFVAGKPDLKGKAEKATVVLYLDGQTKLPPKLAVARAGQEFKELGRVSLGKPMALGWMDFSFILDEYYPSAMPRGEYRERPAQLPGESVEAVEVELDQQALWLELGASGQIASGDALYYVQFTKKQVDIGFDLKLNRFQIGYYEGTTRPRTYSSEVDVGGKTHVISMNEPLVSNGFTFYQSSYEMDIDGTPKYSILSVNYDPGRSTKYLGSLMIVLGIISMFYFKPVYSGKHKWFLGRKESVL